MEGNPNGLNHHVGGLHACLLLLTKSSCLTCVYAAWKCGRTGDSRTSHSGKNTFLHALTLKIIYDGLLLKSGLSLLNVHQGTIVTHPHRMVRVLTQ